MSSEKGDELDAHGDRTALANGSAEDGQKQEESQPNGNDGKTKVDQLKELKEKAKAKGGKQPAGGFDDTPIPSHPEGYNVKFTFHRATSLPMADMNSLSSDPYVLAQLDTEVPSRHPKLDPPMRFRTPTVRRQTEPVWNAEWIVAGVPASGFRLKCRIYDEDPADHDDRLGNVHVDVDHIGESWSGIHEQAYKIKKRMGSKRAYLIRSIAAMCSSEIHMSGNLIVSVEVLGKTEGNPGRVYTVGPCYWTKHFSPMLGRLGGTKSKDDKGVERFNFQANQFQLQGPVPEKMYHRYVEFKPFVKGMFTTTGLRGRILNKALHHQHARVYNFDRSTIYGKFPGPSRDMTLQFLDLVHYDTGGRIYTYVLTLDALFRFTETGKEFGIDMLSKHTMHSDVSIYIAWSGEFFIRRFRDKTKSPDKQDTHPPVQMEGGPPDEQPPKDPSLYELVIDNDSGTYRPNAKFLPELKTFFERSFPGLRVKTLDCNGDKEEMDRMKEEQRERKKREGKDIAYVQGRRGSISSSDEEDLEQQLAGKRKEKGALEAGIGLMKEPFDRLENKFEGGKLAREKREAEDDQAGGPSGSKI